MQNRTSQLSALMPAVCAVLGLATLLAFTTPLHAQGPGAPPPGGFGGGPGAPPPDGFGHGPGVPPPDGFGHGGLAFKAKQQSQKVAAKKANALRAHKSKSHKAAAKAKTQHSHTSKKLAVHDTHAHKAKH